MTLRFHMIDGAPDPVAPFSRAVEADGWVHASASAGWPRGR
jgi:2-iminobutanoate/2-iminopropanoate deaminase